MNQRERALATGAAASNVKDAEDKATSWIIANQLPEYLAEVHPCRLAELIKIRELVTKRPASESERLLLDAAAASE